MAMDNCNGFSMADWLFSLGKFNLKTSVILGRSIPYGAIYLSKFSEKTYVVHEDITVLSRLQEKAFKEKIDNVFFIRASSETLPFCQKSIDYLVVSDNLNESDKIKKIISQAVLMLGPQGILSFPLHGNISKFVPYIENKLTTSGLKYFDFFWTLPSIERATWSGKLNDRKSFRIFANIIDIYNFPGFFTPWMKKIFFCVVVKKVFPLLERVFYLFRKCLLKDCFVFAAKTQEAFESLLPFITSASFVRKTKQAKEGKVIFFVENYKEKKIFYFSRFPEYDFSLHNELKRNIYSNCPVSLRELPSGVRYLVSGFIEGRRPDIYSSQADIKSIKWLMEFQTKTFSGYWNENDWQSFIYSKTRHGQAIEKLSKEFLVLLKNEGKLPAMVAEHGDFDYLNIINVKKDICVIDWELYNSNGDEFYDFCYFLLNIFSEFKNSGFSGGLHEFLEKNPQKDYVNYFLNKKSLSNPETLLAYFPIAEARMRFSLDAF